MPKRAVRNSKRATGLLSFLIGLAAVAAIGLVCAIMIQDRLRPPETEPAATAPGNDFVDVNDLPQTEMVLKASSYVEPGATNSAPGADVAGEPTDTPVPRPTRDPNDPYAALRPLAASMDTLPVFSRAYTEDKVIAITLDECSGAAITGKFVTLAQQYGAKLTLFPIGEYVMKNGMADLLRKCVFQLGFEIENRGYSASAKLYQLPDAMMVREIWMQSVAVSFNLGMKYEPHFFRFYGGLGENDRRTHAYLLQQGYKGVAHWTYSCSGRSVEKMAEYLTPGGIYSFRSNEDDGRLMTALMQAAKQQGYRMVTLNELFGYEANKCYAVQDSLLSETMPAFEYQSKGSYNLLPGEASWDVCLMQSRLAALGYLRADKVDGIFGEGSSDALRLFQSQIGRPASGAGDAETLRRLYADDAPANPDPVRMDAPTPGTGGLLEEGELLPSEDLPTEAPQ